MTSTPNRVAPSAAHPGESSLKMHLGVLFGASKKEGAKGKTKEKLVFICICVRVLYRRIWNFSRRGGFWGCVFCASRLLKK